MVEVAVEVEVDVGVLRRVQVKVQWQEKIIHKISPLVGTTANKVGKEAAVDNEEGDNTNLPLSLLPQRSLRPKTTKRYVRLLFAIKD